MEGQPVVVAPRGYPLTQAGSWKLLTSYLASFLLVKRQKLVGGHAGVVQRSRLLSGQSCLARTRWFESSCPLP